MKKKRETEKSNDTRDGTNVLFQYAWALGTHKDCIRSSGVSTKFLPPIGYRLYNNLHINCWLL